MNLFTEEEKKSVSYNIRNERGDNFKFFINIKSVINYCEQLYVNYMKNEMSKPLKGQTTNVNSQNN